MSVHQRIQGLQRAKALLEAIGRRFALQRKPTSAGEAYTAHVARDPQARDGLTKARRRLASFNK